MYLFVAHYANMETEKKRMQTVEVEEQLCDTEEEIFVSAMRYAYNMKKENEILCSIEFIGGY